MLLAFWKENKFWGSILYLSIIYIMAISILNGFLPFVDALANGDLRGAVSILFSPFSSVQSGG
jgi:hypothetical protein